MLELLNRQSSNVVALAPSNSEHKGGKSSALVYMGTQGHLILPFCVLLCTAYMGALYAALITIISDIPCS
jgi:hypothetical protein